MEEDSDSNEADNDAYSDESDPEEAGEGIAGRQSGSLNGTTASAGFKIQGEHHFSNLCAYLPEYLSGRTKLDLNVINTFAITLHMCNEHSLRLVQEVDPETNLVLKDAMADFKIELAKQ
uniref:Condensin complex subunit 2 n=1 Tax=Ditylenchus dipsaci TaxID=166011 RepID=A0A915EIM9_9BILA